MPDIRTYLLPDQIAPDELRGRVAIVIDVLRASTTIVTALASGAEAVHPFETIEAAKTHASKHPESARLGGERGGRKVAEFDFGNSPSEYQAEVVRGKLICFTTTNGTRALARCGSAEEICIGCFVNLTAVIEKLTADSKLAIVCAGTDGEITREDVLAAGAFAERASRRFPSWTLDDASVIAMASWQQLWTSADQPGKASHQQDHTLGQTRGCRQSSDFLARALTETQGGRNLARIGQADDLKLAAKIDEQSLVPRVDQMTKRITIW